MVTSSPQASRATAGRLPSRPSLRYARPQQAVRELLILRQAEASIRRAGSRVGESIVNVVLGMVGAINAAHHLAARLKVSWRRSQNPLARGLLVGAYGFHG